MKLSLNLAQYYSSVALNEVGADKLVEKIGAQLAAVEEVVEWGPRYDGIVVARVVECVPHPGADKLSVCKVDDGGVVKGANRDKNGLVEVVCGAPNARQGLTTAWIPPGIIVPSTRGKEPLVLEAREIRGVISNGMLASAAELAISDDHSGIIEIDTNHVGKDLSQPGTPFKQLYGLDDVVIDLENKMFTHRPDLFGNIGLARELAGIQHKAFKSPSWYQEPRTIKLADTKLKLKTKNEVPKLVPRFMTQVVDDIKVAASPVWLQATLTRLGTRPINNIVDWSNFYTHLTAQPTHAFDYDKIKTLSGDTPTLGPRLAKEGETLTVLGGKTLTLSKDDMVIATDKHAVALAGIMGGADTEVDENTKTIIIECATFDMYTIRRSSMRHGLFTDASTRFTKGQSPLQNDRVLADMVYELQKYGAQPTKLTADLATKEVALAGSVKVSADFVNERLGTKLSLKDMAALLENVEFKIMSVPADKNHLHIKPPFWRTDIEIPEDVVEEIGRLYGYDHLPLELPKRNLAPASPDPILKLKNDVRQVLSKAGANEVLTYSFIHGDLIAKTGQDKDLAFQLANALSPDLQYYRLSLTPSLLEKVHPNIKSGFGEFAIFELGKAHLKGKNESAEADLPKEFNSLAFVFAADPKTAETYAGAPYYQAKKYLDYLLERFHVAGLSLIPLQDVDLADNTWLLQVTAPYQPARSAVLSDKDGIVWGVVGEFKTSVKKSLKLPDFTAGFELGPLVLSANAGSFYQPLPRFPKVQQDLTLKVPTQIAYQDLFRLIQDQIHKLRPDNSAFKLVPIDIYQPEADQAHKHVTLRLSIASFERTLVDQQVNQLLDEAAAEAHEAFGAERI